MRLRLASMSIAILAYAMASQARAASEIFRFDPVHSQIWFGVDHQHFSHPRGRLRIASGWFAFDDKDWSASRVDVTIDLVGVDMGDAKWNETVKSDPFFDTARYPTAHFISRSVEKTTANAGIIHGDLYFRGATKPVDIAFTLHRLATDPYMFKRKAGFSATATLIRSQFGMNRYTEVVGENIDLEFEIEGVRDDDAAHNPKKDHDDADQK